nr:MAG TPA: hypothetical protein [Caudoviricetes sp.]
MRLSGRLSATMASDFQNGYGATMKREFSAATLRLWLTSWEPCGGFQP